ncbi:Copper homeostasis protein CutF [Paramixta manurensis]|uniref:Copper homeostasis protein CutF n=1 Tax=Paramixta manurensis TaxID=2740817 RepID=A0A6M8U8F7_9GAMM|nr:Copper homeostasis protein CutF [Erwiniaceae bacterium PD-1]
MKNILLAMLATLALGMLFGCNNRTAWQQPPLEPMQQSYHGMLPCNNDCRTTEASLFLSLDGTYVLEQRDTASNSVRTAQYGKWARTADKLTLTEMTGEKQIFRPTNQGLEMVTRQGALQNHGQRFVLVPVNTERT